MTPPARSDVTLLLEGAGRGDPRASQALLPLVYDELRRLAERRLAREPAGATLQATALVHEAWLRLVGDDGAPGDWGSRGHFFGAAAQAMRRILVERARARRAVKRGGGAARVTLAEDAWAAPVPDEDLLALDEALERLSARDERKARVVLLRHFAGLTVEETAAALGVSPATVKSDWAFARAWLARELGGAAP
jgi:RNA polymerase sigma factor (TIGR02999 family)